MKKNKKPLLALILLLFIGTVGVTFAYFGDLIEFPNLFKSKPFSTKSEETFVSPTDWTPGTTTPKEVTVTNTGEVDVLVRIHYKESWSDKYNRYLSPDQNGVQAAIINFDNIDDWYRRGDYYYYNKKLSSGETTSSFIKSITFNKDIIGNTSCTTNGGVQNCEVSNNNYENATYTLNIEIETVQLDQYTNIWHTDFDLPDPNLKNTFANDDWDTISKVFKSGDTKRYKVGDTKPIQLDMNNDGVDETYNLRVANMSSPVECNDANFSQTACGAVIEFSDIITEHSMNSSSNTNVGGWKSSEMRSYLNNNIYNLLPSDLKTKIISTNVVSGHGVTAGEKNFVTTDKLYFFSTKEVGDPYIYDTVDHETRTLDYYIDSTDEDRKKKYAEERNQVEKWWLRSAHSYNNIHFTIISTYGSSSNADSTAIGYVSPAFRVG